VVWFLVERSRLGLTAIRRFFNSMSAFKFNLLFEITVVGLLFAYKATVF